MRKEKSDFFQKPPYRPHVNPKAICVYGVYILNQSYIRKVPDNLVVPTRRSKINCSSCVISSSRTQPDNFSKSQPCLQSRNDANLNLDSQGTGYAIICFPSRISKIINGDKTQRLWTCRHGILSSTSCQTASAQEGGTSVNIKMWSGFFERRERTTCCSKSAWLSKRLTDVLLVTSMMID